MVASVSRSLGTSAVRLKRSKVLVLVSTTPPVPSNAKVLLSSMVASVSRSLGTSAVRLKRSKVLVLVSTTPPVPSIAKVLLSLAVRGAAEVGITVDIETGGGIQHQCAGGIHRHGVQAHIGGVGHRISGLHHHAGSAGPNRGSGGTAGGILQILSVTLPFARL